MATKKICRCSLGVLLTLAYVLLPFFTGAQTSSNSRKRYEKPELEVGAYGRPISPTAYYFPRQLFPQKRFYRSKEDSIALATAKNIDEFSDLIDKTRLRCRLDSSVADTFRLQRFSEYLFALKEPVLFNSSTNKETYRFLWLRTFDPPIVITLEKEGKAHFVSWKVGSGRGRVPNEIIVSERKSIRKAKLNAFYKLLHSADFWDQPPIDCSVGGTDGARWILEGSTPAFYHVVERFSPSEQESFHMLCKYLIQLAPIEKRYRRIY